MINDSIRPPWIAALERAVGETVLLVLVAALAGALVIASAWWLTYGIE